LNIKISEFIWGLGIGEIGKGQLAHGPNPKTQTPKQTTPTPNPQKKKKNNNIKNK